MTKHEILMDVKRIYGEEVAQHLNRATPTGLYATISDTEMLIYNTANCLMLIIPAEIYLINQP